MSVVTGGRTRTKGDLTIAPPVVEKIALRAALAVPDVVGIARGGLPLIGGGRADVHAEVSAATTSIELAVRLRYPAPVATTAAAVQREVARRVHELTGLNVERVAVSVVDLVNDDPRLQA